MKLFFLFESSKDSLQESKHHNFMFEGQVLHGGILPSFQVASTKDTSSGTPHPRNVVIADFFQYPFLHFLGLAAAILIHP